MNCIIIDDDKLSRKVLEGLIAKRSDLSLVASYPDALDASKMFNKDNNGVDLIFLDIEMPEMTGLDFLSSIKDLPQVIIVSSREKYALEAYDFEITDYLLKPIELPRFSRAINRAFKKHSVVKMEMKSNEEIFIKKGASLIKMKLNDILWVEALENYVILNTKDEKFTIHFTMKAIEKKLPQPNFTRIHRSYIVNTGNISIIKDNAVDISYNNQVHSIPIGKSYKEKLLKDINLIAR